MKKLLVLVLALCFVTVLTGLVLADTPTFTPTFTATSTATVTQNNYQSSLWSGRVYDNQGNTFLAMSYYYRAISGVAGYGSIKANDLQDIYYRAGLMLVNKFKSLTDYTVNTKNIANINAPTPKANAQANFAATMTPVYTILSNADINLSLAQGVTKATKDSTQIRLQRSFINSVATYVATY